jgi:hypothetical protein
MREPKGRKSKGRDRQRGGPKESLSSVEGHKRLAELAPNLPDTRLVYVADREADMMPMTRAPGVGLPGGLVGARCA